MLQRSLRLAAIVLAVPLFLLTLSATASAQAEVPVPAAPETGGVSIGFDLESRDDYPHDCRVTVTASGFVPRDGATFSYDVYVSRPADNHDTFLQERHRGVVVDASGFVVVHFFVQVGRTFFVDVVTETDGQIVNVDRSATVQVPPTDGDCSDAGIPTPAAGAPTVRSETTDPDVPTTTDASISVALRSQPNDADHCLATVTGTGFLQVADATRVYETYIDDDGDGVFESYHSQTLVADEAGDVQFFIGVPKEERFYLAFRTEVAGVPVNYDRSETVTVPAGDCAGASAEAPVPTPDLAAPSAPFELVFSPGVDAGTCLVSARGAGYTPGEELWLGYDVRNPERPIAGGGMNLTVQDDGTFDLQLGDPLASGLLIDARVGNGSYDLHTVRDATVGCDTDAAAAVEGAPQPFELVYAPGATGDACSVSVRGTGFDPGATVQVRYSFSGPNGVSGGLTSFPVEADGTFTFVVDDDVASGWLATADLLDSAGATLSRGGGTVSCA